MPDRPNVLYVLCDQMRAQAMGCMGNTQVYTPTLDRTAAEGCLFRSVYSPDPVCSPARASLLTGCYPHDHRVIDNHLRLPAHRSTLSSQLDDAGYETGYIGKWHLDGGDYPGYVPPGPRRHGFEYWEGFNCGHEHLRGHPHVNPDGSADWEDGYQPELQTNMALDFIDQHADSEDPFFLYLSWGPPHTPFDAPEQYSEMYDPGSLDLRPNVPDEMDTPDLREDLAEYYALITSLDDQFERLLAALDQHGIADDTIVVFLSDHGEMLGSHGLERKNYPFEESIHVPLVVRYPSRIERERVESLTCLTDLMPTLLSLCDVPIPDRVHGQDLSSHLLGEEDPSEVGHDSIYLEGQIPYDEMWRTVRTEEYMLTVDRKMEVQYVFNMADDPYQQENLANREEYSDLREELSEELLSLAHEYEDHQLIALEIASREPSWFHSQLEPRGDIFDVGDG